MNRIEKIYVVNLHDRTHRWDLFKEHVSHPGLTRFEAIDSRTNPHVYKNHGLVMNLNGLDSRLYFTQARGAIGVYCSFYSIWSEIVRKNISNALILEDDALVDDVVDYLDSNENLPEGDWNMIQLGKRCDEEWVTDTAMEWDGLEAYVLSNHGAKILTDSTHDNNHFNNIIHPVPPKGWKCKDVGGFKELSVFKNAPKPDWTVPNSITVAADRFVGWNTHAKLPPDKRLNVLFQPCIGLYEQDVPSDIMQGDGDNAYWHMDECQLLELICSDDFEYWNE